MLHRALVVASFLVSAAVIGSGIVSNPNSTIARELANGDYTQRLSGAFTVLVLSAIASWPWIAAFFRASTESQWPSTALFSVFSAGLATYLVSSIAGAPTEGIGYYVIIYVVVVWVAYPISLAFSAKGNDAEV